MERRWYEIPPDSREMVRDLDENAQASTMLGLGVLMGSLTGEAQKDVMWQYREALGGENMDVLDLSKLTPELLSLAHSVGRYIRSVPQG